MCMVGVEGMRALPCTLVNPDRLTVCERLKLHYDISCCCSHMPPELLRHGRMSAAVDIYSYGVMSKCSSHV